MDPNIPTYIHPPGFISFLLFLQWPILARKFRVPLPVITLDGVPRQSILPNSTVEYLRAQHHARFFTKASDIRRMSGLENYALRRAGLSFAGSSFPVTIHFLNNSYVISPQFACLDFPCLSTYSRTRLHTSSSHTHAHRFASMQHQNDSGIQRHYSWGGMRPVGAQSWH